MTPRGAGRLPSMNDVAREAGVSLGTVSNVFNRPESCRAETVQRVQAAVERLGFVRNLNARSLVGAASHTIGLNVFDLGNSLFVDIARGAQTVLRDRGYQLVITDSEVDQARQRDHLDYFDETRVAGVLLAPQFDPTEDVRRLAGHGRRTVVLNHDAAGATWSTVLVDNEHAGYLAASHLAERGARKLAFVTVAEQLQPAVERRLGVGRAVAGMDGVSLRDLHVPDLEIDGGIDAGRALLSLPEDERPDGVICVADLTGMAIVQVLSGAGVRVPDDILVMGCDSNINAWGGDVPLTTVAQHGDEMGAAGARILLDELADPGRPPTRHVIRPELIERASTSPRSR
ncbi:LacI family DNA-binding transcriptional regulator [Tessaracoccus lapidicaptus]|uniref:LacI family DNA-binding transcriptional regulator n=1 Tax=Tessaracoccus lapidicaptus TaxID=1427523 RepID=UPI003340BFCB